MRRAFALGFCLGTVLLAVSCKRILTNEVIIDPRGDFEAAVPTTERATEDLAALLSGGTDPQAALLTTAASVESDDEVDYCEQIANGLFIHYNSGISHFIMLVPPKDQPLEESVVEGAWRSRRAVANARSATGSRNRALLLTPFADEPFWARPDDIVESLTTVGYSPENIDLYSGEQVTVDLVCNLDFPSYSFIYWGTHGASGLLLLTRETYESARNSDAFWDLAAFGGVVSGRVVQFRAGKWVIWDEWYMAITADGLREIIEKPFDVGSVFYADACESAYDLDDDRDFTDVLLGKQVSAYIGWTESVPVLAAGHTASKLIDRLSKGMTIADAFQEDPQDGLFLNRVHLFGYAAELVYMPLSAGSLLLSPGTAVNGALVAVGSYHTVAVRNDATVWAWGDNYDGELGDGTTIDRHNPVQVSGLTAIASVAAGDYHTLAVGSDGAVRAWGDNSAGELGDGTTTNRHTPVVVSGLTGVAGVAAGWCYTVAIKNDGTVWAWGDNYCGELGDGTTTDRHTPVQVSGLTGIVSVAAALVTTVALKSDGTVWAWGQNYHGELGDGTTTNRHTPVQVIGLTDVVGVAAGGNHTLAMKSDGTVWAWGSNRHGELGDGTTTDRHTPVQVSGLTDVVGVAAAAHSIAIRSNGTVWTWGGNYDGELGDGTTTDRHTPVQVSGLTDVVGVAAGAFRTFAIKSDGTVWAWGQNSEGQLGDGTTTERHTPVQVSGLVLAP